MRRRRRWWATISRICRSWNRCGYPVAVRDAAPEVIEAACLVTTAPGGRGAVREVVERLLQSPGRLGGVREVLRRADLNSRRHGWRRSCEIEDEMNQSVSFLESRGARLRRGVAGRGPLLLIGVGVLVALVLIVVVLATRSTRTTSNLKRTVDLDRIAVPSVPTEEELARPATDLDRDVMATLRDGASVQVAGEDGRLAQEYGAVRIDPLPDSWVDMEQPWARLHPSNGRIVEMQAIEGKMRVPDQAIESGRLEGEVRDPNLRAALDGRTSRSINGRRRWSIEAEEARLRRRGRGDPQSPRGSRHHLGGDVRGRGSSNLLRARRIANLPIDRGAGDRTDHSSGLEVAGDHAASSSTVRAEWRKATRSSPTRRRPTPRRWAANRDSDCRRASNRSRSPTTSEDQPVDSDAWYRLVLEDEVLVERVAFDAQGSPPAARSRATGSSPPLPWAKADLDASFATAAPVRGSGMPLRALESHLRLRARLRPACAGTDEPDSELVRVHFSGRLVMIPDPAAAARMRPGRTPRSSSNRTRSRDRPGRRRQRGDRFLCPTRVPHAVRADRSDR